ncbi:transcription factor E2F [Cryptosporidium felis]|nr:transcription factor E2F [Cryptosporidium felis]
MTNEVPYNIQMMGTSSASTNSGNSGDIVAGISPEIIHDSTGVCNSANTNTQDVLSLLSYLVPNSGSDVNCSSVNPPPQIADPVTINELLGLINGAVSSNSTGIKGGAPSTSNSCEPNNLIEATNGNMANSIPYLLPLLMGSGSNSDQNITLLNSLVSSTGNSNTAQGNINQFVSQLQNLLPPIVPGQSSGTIQNNQNLSLGNNGSNHSAEHLQMIYGGGNNINADNKSELLAAAAAFAASNTTPLNISSAGPVTSSRGRARKRASATPLGGMRGRRESTDANKRRGGSPGSHHAIDGGGMPPSGSLLPHIPSLGNDSMEALEHSGSVNMLGTPATHHGASQFNEFSAEDARHSVRFENGLVLMTKRFIQYLYEQGESRIIDLAAAEAHMDVQRRRLYDITNVLEGIGILKKMGRNAFMCSASVPEVLVERDAVLSSFGTVDMSIKLAQSIEDNNLSTIPWFHSYNKLQVLTNSEYEVMEKTLIQRKEQLLQACQQLGFTDIVDQYTIATNITNPHAAGNAVANYAASIHQSRPQNHNTGTSNPRGAATVQHAGISLSHSGHTIRDDSISVQNTIEQQSETNPTGGTGTGTLWGSIMGGSNRTGAVPSIHHPDARWMEATETNHNASKHRIDSDQGSSSGVVSQSENIGEFTE